MIAFVLIISYLKMTRYLIIFSLIGFVCSIKNYSISIFENGGYIAKVCLNESNEIINSSSEFENISCVRKSSTCDNGNVYACNIACHFKKVTSQKIGKSMYKLTWNKVPIFELEKNKNLNSLSISYKGPKLNSSVFLSDIKITFSNHSLSCSDIKMMGQLIQCKLKNSHFFQTPMNVSVYIHYWNTSCYMPKHIGNILFENGNFNPWILFSIIPIALIGIGCVITYVRRYKNRTIKTISQKHSKEIMEKERKFIKLNKLAFLEYQTAIDSFSNLGRLTPRHLLSFNAYISRVFNVELNMVNKSIEKIKELDKFKTVLLNKTHLLQWIDIVEMNGRIKERSLVASLLTLILFQHPEYFLDIVKTLLLKLVVQMQKVSEEKLLFRKSEAVVEKMVGNWITICMYQSLRGGDVGSKFFNLYRALKCKMDMGLVNESTSKAKFVLSFDNLLLGDLEYEVLTVKVSVEIVLKMTDSTKNPWNIVINDLDVEILNLDSIGQVKEKILDKAITLSAEKESIDFNDDITDLSIDLLDHNEFKLELVINSCKLLLEQYDHTSVNNTPNTMKHYNIKTGNKLLLSSNSLHDSYYRKSNIFPSLNVKPDPVQIEDDINKESCLMFLLATKKSLVLFIDGFFQCLTNSHVISQDNMSSTSLFQPSMGYQSCDSLPYSYSNLNSLNKECKEMYTVPIHYLFSMFDDIAQSLEIRDCATIQLWKSNSFILRFWVNLIKNPNFIFSVNKTGAIDGSLTTIASILMESCSTSNSNVDINSPIIKQLFLDEVKNKYSTWWRSFVNSAQFVSDEVMISFMKTIVEKNQMSNHYASSLKSLETITNKFLIQPPVILNCDLETDIL